MKKTCLIGALLVLLAANATLAQTSVPLGLRVGYTGDDFKQIHFGGHARIAELARNLAFQPSIELGLGDNVTLLAGNADLFYEFTELATPDWSFYAGGGLVLSYIDCDRGGDDTNVGVSAAGGVRRNVGESRRLFAELRFGIEDAPDFKLTVGMTFF